MESHILNFLGFQLSVPTTKKFLRYLTHPPPIIYIIVEKTPTIHHSPWHIFSPTSRFSGGSFRQHKPLTRSVTQHPITSNPKNDSEMNKFWNQLLWQAGTLCWTGVPGELYSRANSSWLHLSKVPKLFDCCICRVPRQMDTESVRSPLGLHLSLPY